MDDLVWLSDLSKEGGWIVFTVDRGKSSNIQPLPEICSSLKITHVLLGNGLGKPIKLKQAIVECWEQLKWLSKQKPGTRTRLREERGRNGDVKYVLHEVEIMRIYDKKSKRIKRKSTERKAPKPPAKDPAGQQTLDDGDYFPDFIS